MRDSEARKGENEAWFRDVNERLEEKAIERDAGTDGGFLIVCECAREECTERIAISITVYEAVRSNPAAFIVAPGHLDPAVEQLVSSDETYDVVEKFGGAGLVAQLEDSRSAS
jgi:hypothetical protein